MIRAIMLVIGHRGAAGLAPENTLDALRAGFEAGADMLEFDIRLTSDNVPILHHDFHTLRTQKSAKLISRSTLAELQAIESEYPIATLESVLDEFFGHIILNIEFKQKKAATVTTNMIKDNYIKHRDDWDNCLFSSFKGSALSAVRSISKDANLALLQSQNPFMFIAYQRWLHLTAVGFHRLYVNELALQIAKRLGLFTYAYTVNLPKTALRLQQRGIDGVVTNIPDTILSEIKQTRA